jgi:hypothetical protein
MPIHRDVPDARLAPVLPISLERLPTPIARAAVDARIPARAPTEIPAQARQIARVVPLAPLLRMSRNCRQSRILADGRTKPLRNLIGQIAPIVRKRLTVLVA